MFTKSIRLTSEEAAELRRYVEASGEVEAAVLKRAALRGLRELRLERGTLAHLQGRPSAEAADLAGLPRAEFLQALIEKGIPLLEGPSTLVKELESLAEAPGSKRLSSALKKLSATDR